MSPSGYFQLPGTQSGLNNLQNENLAQYYKLGIGKAGRAAGQDINMFRSGGDVSNVPGFKFALNNILGQQANQDMLANSDIQANTAFAQNGLGAGIQAESQRASDEAAQRNVAGAAQGAYDNALQTFQGARNAQNQAGESLAGNIEKQNNDYVNGDINSYKQQQPGFFKSLLGSALQGGISVGSKFALCDQNYKDNVKDYNGGLEAIEKLKVVEFDYNQKAEAIEGQHGIGLIAQEADKVDPNLATLIPQGMMDNKEDVWVVNTHSVIFMLVNAVQELSKELKEIKGALNDKAVSDTDTGSGGSSDIGHTSFHGSDGIV